MTTAPPSGKPAPEGRAPIQPAPEAGGGRRLFELRDPTATERLGAALAALVRPGDTIALYGDLGAGKTALARALIQTRQAAHGLAVEDVPSPTFTLVQTYAFADLLVWHFDLYRLEDQAEVVELGFEEAAEGVALIEWPERAGPLLPRQRLDIHLGFGSTGEGRTALLAGSAEWHDRLAGLEAR